MTRKNSNDGEGENSNPVGDTAPATPEKKLPLATVTRNETDHLDVKFSDGTTIDVDPAEFSDEIKSELMFLGLQNKIRDSWASAKGSIEFAKGAANKTLDNLKSGLWAVARAAGTGVKKTTELVQAIANLKGRTTDEVQAIVDAATEVQINAWRKNAQVKAEILNIRAQAARARLEKAQSEAGASDFTL